MSGDEDMSPFASTRNFWCLLVGCALSVITIAGIGWAIAKRVDYELVPDTTGILVIVVGAVIALLLYAVFSGMYDWLLRSMTKRWRVDRRGRRMPRNCTP